MHVHSIASAQLLMVGVLCFCQTRQYMQKIIKPGIVLTDLWYVLCFMKSSLLSGNCIQMSDRIFSGLCVCVYQVNVSLRVRPIPCWRPILDTIGHRCTDTNTDNGNNVTYSLRQTYVSYIAHSVRTFQNITSLTAAYLLLSVALQECISYNETNYRLETIGVRATVLTVKTGKRATGIGTDTKISIGRYRYPPILAGIGRYPIPVSV